jgi:hypothetical protein
MDELAGVGDVVNVPDIEKLILIVKESIDN